MDIRTVGVVGAGQMGCGVAHVAALAGYSVMLTDIDAEILDNGIASIADNLDRQIRRGRVDAAERDTVLERISTSTYVKAHAESDLVVESAVERFEIKAEVFRQLDAFCPPETVLASNTSSISITRLGSTTRRPGKVVGMHFMNPVPMMQLVEVIRGLDTSQETIDIVTDAARAMSKTPVECADHPGFVSNRLLMPMINEAIFAVAENVATPGAVDEIMCLGMNHPMGPLALADLIGLDTCLSVMRTLHEELGEPKYRPCPLLIQMVDAGRLGRKSGRGFFIYPEE
ncbi:MAG: 3-hydroxybutyryl-CoA dehydrogenase [Thermoanaerobaculales bacterium]|nr:3-hydroxybutyryl-CoA dehydrogenase [Thermoanaerobaculales bacterium]